MRISGVITDAMLREAAEAIVRHSTGIAAEFVPGKNVLVLSLTDAPYTELVLKIEE